MNKWTNLFLISIALVALFAIMDTMQIVTFHRLTDTNKWELYNQYSAPAILFLWYGILIIIGVMYFIIIRDASEAIAITITPSILLFFGLEDALFFILKPQWITPTMSWFTYPPHSWVNQIFSLPATTFTSLLLTSIFGIVVAWYVFIWLKKQKW